jgi:transcriptional regulator with XRE-family HTH domain
MADERGARDEGQQPVTVIEAAAPGSTVPRRQLGRFLRQLRDAAHMTVKAAAEALEWSPVKIWRIESGQTSMRSHDVRTMCQVYGAAEDTTRALMELAKETKTSGWWHSWAGSLPGWFELYIGLESSASRLRNYEPELVPGLLQTAAYAAEIHRIAGPDRPPADIERRVAVRLGRQAVLTRRLPPPPRLDVLLHESALRRRLPDRQIMAAQLQKIDEVSRLPNVSVRVLTYGAGIHPASLGGGPFIIMEFPHGRNTEPPIIYGDGLTGALYLDKPAEFAAYDELWKRTHVMALTETESRKLISELIKEHEHQ